MKMPVGMRRAWSGYGLPLLLFAGALGLRWWALGWSLPFVEHVDEPALVEVAVRMARDGDLNPHKFLYPSLLYYVWAATARLHALWGVQQGWYQSIQDLPIENYLYTSVPRLLIWQRAVTGLLGAATVPALFVLGKRMFDQRVGLLAALLLALATYHVEHSHYITTDVPTGLWVVGALLGAWQVAGGSRRGYLLAGVMAGLSAGTKYNAGAVILALGVAHLLYWRARSVGKPLGWLVLGGVAAAITFLLTTPYALLDWPTFWAGLRFNADHYATGSHGDFTGRWQVGAYAEFLWREGLFMPASLLLVLGLPVLLRRAPRQTALVLSVVVPEFGLLLSYAVNFVRNLLPILPLLLLLVAAGGVLLIDWLVRPRWRRLALVAAGGVLLAPFVGQTSWLLRYWSRPYTMQAASEVVRNAPRGLRVAAEVLPAALGNDSVLFPVEHVTEHPAAWYRARGFRYLIVNDDARKADDERYAALRAATTVVAEYPPRRAGLQPGPGGAVLDLGVQPDQLLITPHRINYSDQVLLLGYELAAGAPRSQATPLEGANQRTLAVGQAIQLNLYWQVLKPMATDYTLFVHVLDAAGTKVAQRDLPLRYAEYPTSRWQPGEIVVDRADLPLPALPPGAYQVAFGLYDASSGAGLTPQPDRDSALPAPITLMIAE